MEKYEAQEEEVDEMREELFIFREQLQRARVETEELREKVEKSETQTKQDGESGWGWGEEEEKEEGQEKESEEVSLILVNGGILAWLMMFLKRKFANFRWLMLKMKGYLLCVWWECRGNVKKTVN